MSYQYTIVTGGSWDDDQVLWELHGVGMQVTGLVATPGVSWNGEVWDEKFRLVTRSCGSC